MQMAGQYQKAFQQGGQDHTDHHEGNVEGDLAHGAAHHAQGQEGGNGGGTGSYHRPEHPACAPQGGTLGGFPLLQVGQRVLAHHNGIVDDDPQGQNQAEQTDHVDGAAEQPDQAQGGHEGHRDAHGDPPGHPGIEEEIEGGDHQQQTADAVPQQGGNALLYQLPGLEIEGHLYAFREGGAVLRAPAANLVGQLQHVPVFAAHHLQFDGRVALIGEGRLVIPGASLDGGHVAQTQLLAVGGGNQGQVGEGPFVTSLAQGAQLFGSVIPARSAGGYVLAETAHPVADFAQTHTQIMECRSGHLDGHFLFRQAQEVHLAGTQGEDLVFHVAHQRAQFFQGAVFRGHHDGGDQGVVGDLLDHRSLRVLRQIADGVDALADLVQGQAQVGAVFQLDKDSRGALLGAGDQFLGVGQGLDGLLHGDGNGALYILRAGASPGDGDGDVVEIKIRKQLGIEPVEAEKPEHHHQQHQQIRCDLVLGKAGDQAPRFTHPDGPRCGCRRHCRWQGLRATLSHQLPRHRRCCPAPVAGPPAGRQWPGAAGWS